ncbi:hypothetical protein C1N64_14615 [Pantoea sp. SGAir0215]
MTGHSNSGSLLRELTLTTLSGKWIRQAVPVSSAVPALGKHAGIVADMTNVVTQLSSAETLIKDEIKGCKSAPFRLARHNALTRNKTFYQMRKGNMTD